MQLSGEQQTKIKTRMNGKDIMKYGVGLSRTLLFLQPGLQMNLGKRYIRQIYLKSLIKLKLKLGMVQIERNLQLELFYIVFNNFRSSRILWI